MVKRLLRKLGYLEEEPQYFLSKRICGIWLIWVSVVILIGTFFGGSQEINMIIFNIGYFLGFILILGNKRVHNKFAFGPPSKFQNNMTLLSIILMFILLVGMGGQFFATQNYRMIWLSALFSDWNSLFSILCRTRENNASPCYFSFAKCHFGYVIFFYSVFYFRLY